MKKSLLLFTLFLSFSSALFADGTSCYYLKLGGGARTGDDSDAVILGGVGRRASCGLWGLDLSIQGGERYFAAPRIMGLRYFRDCGARPYVGAGLSYGGVNAFTGLMAEGSAGLEFCIARQHILFLEFGVSQPLLTTRSHKDAKRSPALTLSLGAGF